MNKVIAIPTRMMGRHFHEAIEEIAERQHILIERAKEVNDLTIRHAELCAQARELVAAGNCSEDHFAKTSALYEEHRAKFTQWKLDMAELDAYHNSIKKLHGL